MGNRRMRAAAAVSITAVIVLALTACMPFHSTPQPHLPSTPAASPQSRAVSGFLLIRDPTMTDAEIAERQQRLWDTGDDSCVAAKGFEDIAAGGAVQLRQPDGTVVSGVIGTGVWDSDAMSANHILGCGFPFTVEGVALLEGDYGLRIAGGDEPGWVVSAGEIRTGPRIILG
ncbi:hypothetical protein NY547_00720 [Cnuibacter physcomitrellae]|uniref:hypothetical protein n=1 Tax=Cnuibacter physcomitrellae TaxID=1619308 RepID=UPI002175BB5B|nr:hypothetical protein [Cnuibacter physcomitrellae]MCS5495760.1 hypothetical protein [Cnuibacter physcomitrellae]